MTIRALMKPEGENLISLNEAWAKVARTFGKELSDEKCEKVLPAMDVLQELFEEIGGNDKVLAMNDDIEAKRSVNPLITHFVFVFDGKSSTRNHALSLLYAISAIVSSEKPVSVVIVK